MKFLNFFKSKWKIAWIIVSILVYFSYTPTTEKEFNPLSYFCSSLIVGAMLVGIVYYFYNKKNGKKEKEKRANLFSEQLEKKKEETIKNAGKTMCKSCGGPVGIHEKCCPYCRTVNDNYKKP